MEYWVDAYNLFFRTDKEQTDETSSLKASIEGFITTWEKIASHLHLPLKFFFDNRARVLQPLPSITNRGYLDIVFTPSEISADDYILELLHWRPKQNLTLISSDKGLTSAAKHLGCRILSSEQFLLWVDKKTHALPQEKRTSPKASPEEKDFQHLLEEFSKRYATLTSTKEDLA